MKPARTVQKGGTEWLSHPMVGPVGGGVLVAFLSHSSGASQEVSLLAALAFVGAVSVTARPQAWRRFV
jgi:hypothetical protein